MREGGRPGRLLGRKAVDREGYLEAIRGESAALSEAAVLQDLEAGVPPCPGWTVRDLLVHISQVQRFWQQIVARRLQSRADVTREPLPADDELIEWFQEGAGLLVAALEEADPGARVWTWAPRKDVAFVVRRQAHEAAVHRTDAQSVSGSIAPLDGPLAADGVDEFFEYMLPEDPPSDLAASALLLSSTDGQGHWFLRMDHDRVSVDRTGAGTQPPSVEPGVVVEAPASDLDLLLWRRIPMERVGVAGDAAILARFLAWPDLA
jgi:uncharacterized protein (TIGR03083 family)